MPPQSRAPQLDGLRALAALGVLLAHFNPAPLALPPGSFSAAWFGAVDRLAVGNLAVAFFFALSGFVFPAVDRLPWGTDVLITLRLGLSVLGAVLFAAVSHLLIERPFLRLKSLWRPPGRPAT